MAKRILTGLLIAVGVITAVWWGPYWLVAPLFGLVLLGAQQEFYQMPATLLTPADRIAGGLISAGFLAIAALSGPGVEGCAMLLETGMAATVMLLLWVLFSPHPIASAGGRATLLLGGLLYVGLLGSTAILTIRPENSAMGRTVFLLCAAVAGLGDSAAYFGGKTLGRHKMYPAISPNKTWEGSFFGVMGSVLGALIIATLCMPDMDMMKVAAFALIGAFLGQTGDLVESMFKRSANIKDSGNILPGHGGLLDRIDAFLFIVPFGYFFFL